MKRIMWFSASLSMMISAVVLKFVPGKLPLQYDIYGKTVRWGSKYIYMVFPGIIVLLAVFWSVMLSHMKHRACLCADEDRRSADLSNIKILEKISSVSVVCFLLINIVILIRGIYGAGEAMAYNGVDTYSLITAVFGVMFVVCGILIPWSRRNGIIGLRIKWSLYNDTTWKRSNSFAGVMLMGSGACSVVTAALVGGSVSEMLMLAYLAAACIISFVYSRKVYLNEKQLAQGESY